MTDNRTTELLPCPFCGGNIREPITKRWTNCLGDVSYSAWVECEKCNLTIETDRCGYETEESAENAAIAAWNTRASERHAYEQRITGDGSDWGEIMRGAYDDLMANACESCTPEQMEQLTDYIRAELGSRTCKPTEPERCLDGTDCPAWLCSECGELFELGANFCSNCGAKVVSA